MSFRISLRAPLSGYILVISWGSYNVLAPTAYVGLCFFKNFLTPACWNGHVCKQSRSASSIKALELVIFNASQTLLISSETLSLSSRMTPRKLSTAILSDTYCFTLLIHPRTQKMLFTCWATSLGCGSKSHRLQLSCTNPAIMKTRPFTNSSLSVITWKSSRNY